MDSVEKYLEVFEGLRRSKRWSTDTNILRFAALTLAAANLRAVQSIIEAQQAAMIACIAATTAATTAATAS